MILSEALHASPWPVLQGRSEASSAKGEVLAILAPHPDDEAIGPGGSAILESHERPVIVFYLTEGARGISGRGGEAERRKLEAEACVCEMGIAAGLWLGYSSDDVRRQDSRVKSDLGSALGHFGVEEFWIPSPYEHHPTHVASTVACLAAISMLEIDQRPTRLLGYGVWDPIPYGPDVERRVISEVMDQKKRSILVHESQCQVRPLDEAIFGLNRYEGLFRETTGGEGMSPWCESLLDMGPLIGQSPESLIAFVENRAQNGPIARLRGALSPG